MKLNYLLLVAAMMAQGSKALAVTTVPQMNCQYSVLAASQTAPTTQYNALVIEPVEDVIWNNQLSIKLTSNLEKTKTYKLTVVCKASKACDMKFVTKGLTKSNKEEDVNLTSTYSTAVGTDWDTYTLDITPTAADTVTISDDFTLGVGGLAGGSFEVKSISLTEANGDTNLIPNGDLSSTAIDWYKRYDWHKFTFGVQQLSELALETYNETPIDYDYTTSGTPVIGGWGANLKAEVVDGALVWSHGQTTNYWEAQAAIDQVFVKGGTYKITLTVKGEAEGNLLTELQSPNIDGGGYPTCGSFNIPLTTDFVDQSFDVKCTGDGATKLIFNLGAYNNKVYVKKLKVEASYKQEVLSVGETSFATHYAAYPVNYSEAGLTAYAVKLNTDFTGVTYTPIYGVVPAMTTVLVKGNPGTDYVLPKADEDGVTVDTDLKTSAGNATTTDNRRVYGLATKDGVDGFYAAKAGVKIPAKLGFLEVAVTNNTNMTALASMFPIEVPNTLTGLSHVEKTEDKAPADTQMYNLSGQKVGPDYKGIVVVNGKKMILK